MQKGLRKIIIIPLSIVAFVLIGLLSGYLSFKLLSFSKTVEVPDLRGKTLFEANDLLNQQRLNLKVEGEEFDPTVAAGLIMRQDIPPGNKVKEQRGIRVFLSKGPKVWSIPDVVGLPLADAEGFISQSGMKVNKVIRLHSFTAEQDKVLAQRPAPDEMPGVQTPLDLVSKHRGISLIVSAGPYATPLYCPDFYGKGREDALNLAEKLHITVEFTGSGLTVRSQKPKPNTLIKSGETVVLSLEGG